jgi:cobalt-zinc-cadmium efflux system outer membrane protein
VLAHSEARIDSATAGADLAEAERTLAALAPTAGARAWPQLPDDLAPIELGPNDARALIAAVPEVRLQRDRVAAADAAVTLRERERRASPTLRLVGGEEDGESLIGVGFSMPLNVRNRFEHEVEAARASSVQAERELDNVTVRARAALEAAAARYGLTRAAWREWLETGAPNLAEQTALLDRLWRAGELDVTDYLVQLDQTLATQASALDLELRLRRAWLDWLAASAQLGDWLGTSIETL